jgi:RNA polymerase sigma factor (sigma-70 family)
MHPRRTCWRRSRPRGRGGRSRWTSRRIGTDDPGFELVEDRATLDATANILDETEREVLRLRFGEDLTQSRIAERVGYSQMHVSRILRRALGKLRDAAALDGAAPAEEKEPRS